MTPAQVQTRVEKIVFDHFYGSPLSGSKARLATALIEEFDLTADRKPLRFIRVEEFDTFVCQTPEVVYGITREGPWTTIRDLRRAVLSGEIDADRWAELASNHRFEFPVFDGYGSRGGPLEDVQVSLMTEARRLWNKLLIWLLVGREAK